MASIQITALPLAIALSGAEQIEMVQAGTSVRVTVSQIFSFATGLVTPFTVPLGGTGLATLTLNGLMYGNGISPVQQVAVGATGQVLIGNTAAAPSWAAATGVAVTSLSFGTTGLTPNSAAQGVVTVAGTLIVGNGGTGAATFTANGIIFGNTAGALQVTAAGTTGQFLIGNTGSAPTWAAATGLAVTSISFGTTGLTPSAATQGVVTVAGTLVVGNGGTGVATLAANGVLFGNAAGAVQVTAQGPANSILIANAGAPSFTASPIIGTQVTVPLVIGGSAVGSSLTLQSTSASGTTDTILFKVGNAGATTALTIASATTLLKIGAGTATLAPLTLTSGTILTTAVAGVMEYDGSVAYFSPAASTRGALKAQYAFILNTAYTLTNATGLQKMFNNTVNGQFTLPVGNYEFECYCTISALPATGTFGFALSGSKISTESWQAEGARVAAGTAATGSSSFNTSANVAVCPTSATTTAFMWIRGTINVTGSGTLVPQFSMTTTSAAAIIGVGSYFFINSLSGTSGATNITIGNAS